ncbi:MAG: hypothetical protein KQI35_07565 [Bacteroidetes bacterium]|nr:hypothetical protein [Bacteroidota bacterium]
MIHSVSRIPDHQIIFHKRKTISDSFSLPELETINGVNTYLEEKNNAVLIPQCYGFKNPDIQ